MKFSPEIIVLDAHKSHGSQGSSRPQAPGRESYSALHVQLSSETELIKMCVAPSSLRPVLCMFEDREGPYAGTQFYLEF